MALEKKWEEVPPQLFTSNGSPFGVITVADTAGFKAKQAAYLKNTANQNLAVQVKRVLSSTTLVVGPKDNKLGSWQPLDISTWTVSSGAAIGAQEQDKNNIPWEDHYAAVYEADPTVADRVVFVDKYGQFYDSTNPLPIEIDGGDISIGSVSIIDPDTDVPLKVNNDGSINVVVDTTPTAGGTLINTYNEVVAVAQGSLTQIVTYTVPPGTISSLQKGTVSGENIARFDILINGIIQDTVRTYFGGGLNGIFNFDAGLSLVEGDVVIIQVLHNRPDIGSFEGRIQVLEMAA